MDLTTALGAWLMFAGGFAAASSLAIFCFAITEAGRLGVLRPRRSRHDAGGDGSGRAGDGSSARRFQPREEI